MQGLEACVGKPDVYLGRYFNIQEMCTNQPAPNIAVHSVPSISPDDHLGFHRRHIFDKLHTHRAVSWLVAHHWLLKVHHVWRQGFEQRVSDFVPAQQTRGLSPSVALNKEGTCTLKGCAT